MRPNIKLRVLPAVFVAIALSPLGALAQTSPVASPGMTTTTAMADDRGEREEHHDFGWLGLIGLLGLGGLLGKKHYVRGQESSAELTGRRALALRARQTLFYNRGSAGPRRPPEKRRIAL